MITANLAALEAAAETVYEVFAPTHQYCWPLLSQRAGCEVWVKHENQTPTGAFKVRGGLVYMADRAANRNLGGVITATRGNHGQSIAMAARRYGINATIVVPKGNSAEKNAAMTALGGTLIEHGEDFQDAREYAEGLAESEGLFFLPSFHPLLVSGVGTYALEFFRGQPDLDVVYVSIGLGSGICGVIAARDALGLKTKIVGVVAEGASAYARSFSAGYCISTNRAETIADGLACRVPIPEAVEVILTGAENVVTVSEAEITEAMRVYFTDTHTVAEGAGAAPLAALLREKSKRAGKKVGVVLTGGNVDQETYTKVLNGA